jgi:hypothetical protein
MRKIVAMLFVITMALPSRVALAQAQEETKPSGQSESAKTAAQESTSNTQRPRPIRPYRLDFSVHEMENGKTVNSRRYSLNVTAGSPDELKIGARVPVSSGGPGGLQYQYVDLGTNIWTILQDGSDELQLEVRCEISWSKAAQRDSEVDPKQEHGPAYAPPIVSQIKIGGKTLLVTGKPMIIGSVDDPYSDRQFQLEVTATKLR